MVMYLFYHRIAPPARCFRYYSQDADKKRQAKVMVPAVRNSVNRDIEFYAFSSSTSNLPIKTPMADAIMSPRVQPLESPKQ